MSPVSGLSNVRFWLGEHGHDASDEALARHVFDAAKRINRVLRDEELEQMVREYQGQPASA